MLLTLQRARNLNKGRKEERRLNLVEANLVINSEGCMCMHCPPPEIAPFLLIIH